MLDTGHTGVRRFGFTELFPSEVTQGWCQAGCEVTAPVPRRVWGALGSSGMLILTSWLGWGCAWDCWPMSPNPRDVTGLCLGLLAPVPPIPGMSLWVSIQGLECDGAQGLCWDCLASTDSSLDLLDGFGLPQDTLLDEFSRSAGAGQRLSRGLGQLQVPTRSSCGSWGELQLSRDQRGCVLLSWQESWG